MDSEVSTSSMKVSNILECADEETHSPHEQSSRITETSISGVISTFITLPSSDAIAYFDSRLDYLHGTKNYLRLSELLIALGKLAIHKNTTFLNSLINVGDYAKVEQGEVCASKLTSRFHSWGLNDSKYIFTLTNGIVQAIKDRNTDLFYVLNGDHNSCPIVTISGPEGGGKSYLLQYIVRKLRSVPSNRVIYIPYSSTEGMFQDIIC